MLKLLVAVDGSEHARHAIEAAGRLAKAAPGTEVVLLNVRQLPVYYGDLPAYDSEALEQAGRLGQATLLDEALAQARSCGLERVQTQAAVGLPAPEIARLASELAVDQIVMGTHGRNALAGLVMGSVAQRVVHLVSVPVTLVR